MRRDMNCRPAEQRIEMDSHEVGDLTIHIEARPVRERISIAMIPYLPMQNLKISYYCSLFYPSSKLVFKLFKVCN